MTIIKEYMIPVYALLVAGGTWLLEPIEGDKRKAVPEVYRPYVAQYLAEQQGEEEEQQEEEPAGEQNQDKEEPQGEEEADQQTEEQQGDKANV